VTLFGIPTQFLVLPALLIGLVMGYTLNVAHHRRTRKPVFQQPIQPDEADDAEMSLNTKKAMVSESEVQLSQLEVRLAYLTKSLTRMREQVDAAESEQHNLLLTLDERQGSVSNAQQSLSSIREDLETRNQEASSLLKSIDRSIEELDLLNQMQEGYTVKINRLTQQVQWQDGELRMLRQTVKAKTTEIDEAKALLDQRDAELRLLIRQRQQREIDIAHARQQLVQRDDELRRQVAQVNAQQVAPREAPARPLPSLPRISYLPPATAREESELPDELPVAPEPSRLRERPPKIVGPTPEPASDDPGGDDLTVIPRLAEYYASQLRQKGITTVGQLARLSTEEVQAMLYIPGHHSPHIEAWLKAARRLARRRRTVSEEQE
jgi:predicted flap endonuclease-1-like 5' DNA nuclease